MMEVRLASQPAPGRVVNEDYALSVGDLVAVFDGVTEPAGSDNGCIHGSAWYVRLLAARLAAAYTAAPQGKLSDLLAAAITAVRDEHGGGCDLNHAGTPAASLCLVRLTGEAVEYLVLCDTPLVLDRGDRVDVIRDDRFDQVIRDIRAAALVPGAIGTAAHDRRVRRATVEKWQHTNRPGGYWIAAADPRAAYEAVTGTARLTGPHRVRRAALLTDGASAAVEQFGLFDWAGLLDVLTNDGPAELIRQVRDAESADSHGQSRPRYKRHDDATAALCLFGGDSAGQPQLLAGSISGTQPITLSRPACLPR